MRARQQGVNQRGFARAKKSSEKSDGKMNKAMGDATTNITGCISEFRKYVKYVQRNSMNDAGNDLLKPSAVVCDRLHHSVVCCDATQQKG